MKLSPGAEAAWLIAAGEAAQAGHARIEPAHLLIGVLSLGKIGPQATVPGLNVDAAMVREESTCLDRAFARVGLDATVLRRRSRTQLGRGPVEGRSRDPLSRSLTCKAVFAAAEALAGQGRPVGPAHLLAALTEGVDSVTADLIRASGTSPAVLAAAALEAVPGPPTPSPPTKPARARAFDAEAEAWAAAAASSTPLVDRFGRDLTALARRSELGPITGRGREVDAVLAALASGAARTPILVGEVGVGKTAVVEAIAVRAAEGKAQALPAGSRIVELSIGALRAGAGPGGAFGERMLGLFAEARAHPEVLLFLSEIHAVGGAFGLLRPALLGDGLRCIAAITPAEYQRHVTSDPPLERRAAKVVVEEPDRDGAVEILRGLRARLEGRYGVNLPDEALAAAVELSLRFEPDRRLPGKAIDLVVEAAARTRPAAPGTPPAPGEAGAPGEGHDVPTVTPTIVASVFAEKRRVPLGLVVDSLDQGMGSRLLSLEAFLKERVRGQDRAIGRVTRRLRLAFASPGQRQGPLAVLLLVGPSGVGKTETARLVAEHLFGSASGLIRVDLSEMRDALSTAKLRGRAAGPDGPVGAQSLAEVILQKPQAVLLLDEVEKAHPRVLEAFLPLLREGRLADARGRTADARQLVVILTANPGASGLPSLPAGMPDHIHEVVSFRALDPDDVVMIVGRALDELTSAVERRHGVRVRVSPEAARFAAEQAAASAPGARGARRTVERLIHGPLGALVLTGKLTRHPAWVAVYDEGGIYLLPEGW